MLCRLLEGRWNSHGGRGGLATGQRSQEVGEEALLEGGAESSTFEWLRRTVVVHHAAVGLALSVEEQAAEFSHL